MHNIHTLHLNTRGSPCQEYRKRPGSLTEWHICVRIQCLCYLCSFFWQDRYEAETKGNDCKFCPCSAFGCFSFSPRRHRWLINIGHPKVRFLPIGHVESWKHFGGDNGTFIQSSFLVPLLKWNISHNSHQMIQIGFRTWSHLTRR